MAQIKSPEFPEIFKKPPGLEKPVNLELEIRGAAAPSGPYGPPRPGEKAPHKDAGQLVNDIIGDFQAAGETICDALDTPFDQTIGIKGPHRLIDGGLDTYSGILRNVVSNITRWKE